ncbi:hypothetical protein A2419_01615 [Candidatus Adlerbacteria bacterium RIFOXYC1_FULL_48_26]|uniref:GIY-YIG domain-containing protein n=1 Tax=Candidatus Adlerbacteria bacterium RIFOXYC1_FULL_48_26 TaxID=1797247 RepID=A0A1F4Y3H5_9BACT|nr:MAG: hypothetical protein A2419_01615 [Candidatus Adlerbacteria bacterium RIFOXYC1_FULL_48_26]OGC93407.1 MAG: hypothetical protein A2389_02565 [Candidatus Adlerbacteria bacterium RIFOXYB1_FULL_48_10]OGC95952.1 MAG: hypothetical protein A2590_00110 [Candidatus Adlerbacteria bacterium RIFOXYD1_FULL_48_8]
MWTVYILKSLKDGKFYIGCTKNLKRRLKEHDSGYTASTASRRPFELMYTERYSVQADAYAREKVLKAYKGGEALKRLFEKK